jgi:preprotein translocase subunit SecA
MLGAVTLATNMAGRGVDIKLGGPKATEAEATAVKELGGLFVLGTERHEARRIDNQLRGRSGRQGDAGTTQFYVSMEDSLMRIFGGDRVKRLMGTFGIPADQPIEMKLISRQLESAQTRIEGFHFDSRKQVLAYDDVLNQQRMGIYDRRKKVLTHDEGEVALMLEEVKNLSPEVPSLVSAKISEIGDDQFIELFQRLSLQMIDTLWVEHLEVMNYTRNSVNLRAYGQRDPLVEYRKEGTRLFAEMKHAVLTRIIEVLPRLMVQAVDKDEAELKKQSAAAISSSQSPESVSEKSLPSVTKNDKGRNEIVTVTNGTETRQLKFKKAQELLSEGWTLV